MMSSTMNRSTHRGRQRAKAYWVSGSKTFGGLIIVVIMLFPVYWMLNASLQTSGALISLPVQWLPLDPDWSSYANALAVMPSRITTSLTVGFGVVALTLVLAVPAAYALAQIRLRGAGTILFAIALVQMLPGIVMANALYETFRSFSLLNTHLALILTDTTLTLPFAVLILRSSMIAIPGELSEAARVDGANYFRTMWSIIIPLSRNSIITAALFSFLFAWADFLFAVTLNTDGSIVPVTLEIYRTLGLNATDWNVVMAKATIAALPAAILLVFAQRFITAGLAGTALKE